MNNVLHWMSGSGRHLRKVTTLAPFDFGVKWAITSRKFTMTDLRHESRGKNCFGGGNPHQEKTK